MRKIMTYFLMKLRKYYPTLKTIMQKLNEYFLILILVICIYCKYPVLSPKPLENSAPELFSLCSLRSARRSTLVWSQTASDRLSFYCTSKNLHMMLMKLQTQSHTVHWLTCPLFTSLLFVRPHGDISIYDVLDNTNHIFSESLSSGNDNDWDEDLQKDKDTQTQTHCC